MNRHFTCNSSRPLLLTGSFTTLSAMKCTLIMNCCSRFFFFSNCGPFLETSKRLYAEDKPVWSNDLAHCQRRGRRRTLATGLMVSDMNLLGRLTSRRLLLALY